MLERFFGWSGLPPLTLLWLALLEGPTALGGFVLGVATMMIFDLFTREWVAGARREEP